MVNPLSPTGELSTQINHINAIYEGGGGMRAFAIWCVSIKSINGRRYESTQHLSYFSPPHLSVSVTLPHLFLSLMSSLCLSCDYYHTLFIISISHSLILTRSSMFVSLLPHYLFPSITSLSLSFSFSSLVQTVNMVRVRGCVRWRNAFLLCVCILMRAQWTDCRQTSRSPCT